MNKSTLLTVFLASVAFLVTGLCNTQAFAGTVEDEVGKMLARGAKLVHGHDEALGDYIIASVKIKKSWGDNAISEARLEATDRVGKFFGVQVSGSKESRRESESTSVDGEKHSTFKKSFKIF